MDMKKRVAGAVILALALVLAVTGCALRAEVERQSQAVSSAPDISAIGSAPEPTLLPAPSAETVSGTELPPLKNEYSEGDTTISSSLSEDDLVSLRELEVDLSNAKNYYDLNLFLSNFSECGIEKLNNDATQENMETAVRFAFYHRWWNGGGIESDEYTQFPVEGYEDVGMCYNLRISKERAAQTLRYFLYESPGLPERLGPDTGFQEDSDYYYSFTTGGEFPGGFVLADATSVTNDPLHTLQVDFHVYEPFLEDYLDDKSVYGLRADEVEERFENYTVRRGMAEVIFTRGEDGSYTYKLRSYRMNE